MPSTSSAHGLVGPSLANFCVQYNFQVIAIALLISARVNRQQDWVKTQNTSVIFLGCILGQFTMGYAGDLVGRSRALSLTLLIAAAGAVGSSTCAWGSPASIYGTVVAFRFVIGYGLGGVYPLSATKAAESDDGANSVGRTAWAFFWQGPGMCAPYVAAIVLRACLQSDAQDLQWRLLLGLGALPALLALGLLRSDARGDAGRDAAAAAAAARARLAGDAKTRRFWKRFAGAGGAWFLFDVALYGTTLLGPAIVEECFRGRNSIQATAWQQLVGLSFNIPALYLSVELLNRKQCSAKKLQIAGFLLMAGAYALYGVLDAMDVGPWCLYAAYCFLNFTLSFGPNVTTFVLPAATFDGATRSTMNGFCSALGKVGAVVGTEVLPVLRAEFGLAAVLGACLATSIGGALLTAWAVEGEAYAPVLLAAGPGLLAADPGGGGVA